ncbi:MAG TPA: cellobiose phosphorylase, partial [Candidatus Omnitrophota bacterium]|nr:cellobiose phosphorylase [Candidatus Omnitrophota bacterium]
MKNKLWYFTDDDGTFVSGGADKINALYFPLANEVFMSSVTPDLHGDAKTSQDSFLYEPVSRLDLSNSRSSRNFWVRTSSGKIWSATGVSKDLEQIESDVVNISAGLLWHRARRENKKIGFAADILTFVPSTGEPAEITSLTLTNISSRPISFSATAAIPIYARSAENIRDHRHV